MDKGEKTKQKVMEAALSLFNVKGFNGTSIRAIADKAGVNVALISYYFGNKQGLLEKLMIDFLEGYTKILEEGYGNLALDNPRNCLTSIVETLLCFQQKNHYLARFVHREVSLDSTLVRELMITYFMKEKHFFKEIIEKGIKQKEFQSVNVDIFIIQIRALITMPYSQPQYIREVYHLNPCENYFAKKYLDQLNNWLQEFLFNKNEYIYLK